MASFAGDVPPRRPGARGGVIGPLLLVIAGMGAMLGMGLWEARWVAAQPWSSAVWATGPADGLPDVTRIQIRVVALDAVSPMTPVREGVAAFAEYERGFASVLETINERFLAVPLTQEELEPLLTEGRLPEPGQREVLAGALTKADAFTLDGIAFTVTGRMGPATSGLLFAYLAPEHPDLDPFFAAEAGAETGWLATDMTPELADALSAREMAGETWETPRGGYLLAAPWIAWGTLIATGMAALGGAMLHFRLLAWWRPRAGAIMGPLLEAVAAYPRLFIGCHWIYYAAFFLPMAAGLAAPQPQYFAVQYVGHLFAEGDLSHIGDAYASGDVLAAAQMTFYNNFVVQTLLLTFLISLPPLALGAFKVLASFAMAGYGMAPNAAGSALGYSFHAVTIVVELQAYIMAVFAVLIWTRQVYRSFVLRSDAELLYGFRVLLGGALFTAIWLWAGAVYEGYTLINFGVR